MGRLTAEEVTSDTVRAAQRCRLFVERATYVVLAPRMPIVWSADRRVCERVDVMVGWKEKTGLAAVIDE
jgi:hypothetical protein